MRHVAIVNDNYYHIFNRGVNKGSIFFADRDYQRFFEAAVHYISKNSKFSYERKSNFSSDDPVSSLNENVDKVSVLAYCLMPNHFHFLVKQLANGGVTDYFRRLANSYSHYINVKYKRTGPLFESRFKNVLVKSDDQLLHLSRYIHLNPIVSGLVKNLDSYIWSSYRSYVDVTEDNLSNPEDVLNNFKSKDDYRRFVMDQVDYGKQLEKLKHLVLEK